MGDVEEDFVQSWGLRENACMAATLNPRRHKRRLLPPPGPKKCKDQAATLTWNKTYSHELIFQRLPLMVTVKPDDDFKEVTNLFMKPSLDPLYDWSLVGK